MRRPVIGIEPAGFHARVDAAENVARRAVANQDCMIRIKIRDFCKATVKIDLARFIRSNLFRNEDFLKKRRNAGTFQSTLLHHGVPVGNEIQQIFSIKFYQKLLYMAQNYEATERKNLEIATTRSYG